MNDFIVFFIVKSRQKLIQFTLLNWFQQIISNTKFQCSLRIIKFTISADYNKRNGDAL